MIVRIFGRDEIQRTVANVYGFRHLHEINKLDVLTGYLLEPIEKGERILYQHRTGKWYEFIIDEPEIIHDEGIKYYFTAVDSLVEIDGDWVEDKRPSTLANAVAEILAPTRWTVGTVTSKPAVPLTFYRISAREALDALIGAYPVEIQTRITVGTSGVTERTLDVLDRVGSDLGKRFVYDKDVTTVKRTYKQGKIITALRGYGKGEEIGEGFGRRIDFSSINGGLDYVFDPAVLAIYGRVNGGSRAHVFDYVNYEDVDDKAVLLALTQAEYLKRSVPQVSYEATVVDLGLEHENVGIGDTVKVIDGLHRFETRVNYLLEDEDNTNQVRLANYIKNITDSNKEMMQKVGALASHAGVWDESQKIADGSYLDGVLDALNDQANATGGWTFIKDGEGLLTINAPTEAAATKAVNIVGGTIRVASYKNGDGTWKWRTFITGEIVAADMITAGVLKGGKVNWNLETGVLYIGDSTETASLLWDGTSLLISQGAVKLDIDGIEIGNPTTTTIAKHKASGTYYVDRNTGNPFASYESGKADIDRLNVEKVYSPHVLNKLSQDIEVFVDSIPTGDQSGRDSSNKAPSVKVAVDNALDGALYLDGDIIVQIGGDQFAEDILLEGYVGKGKIELIGFYGSTQYSGSLTGRNCTCTISTENLTLYSTGSGPALMAFYSCADVRIKAPRLDGANNRPAILSDRSIVTVESGPISNCTECFHAQNLGQIFAYDTYGVNNGIGAVAESGGRIIRDYRMPLSTTDKTETSGGTVTGTATATGSTFTITPPVWQTVTKSFTSKLSTANHSTGYTWKTGTWTQGSFDGTAQRGTADFGTTIKTWLDSAGGYQNISSVILKAHRNTSSGYGTVSLKIATPSAQTLEAVPRGGTSQAALVSGLVTAMQAGALKLKSSTTATGDYAGYDKIEIIVTVEKKI